MRARKCTGCGAPLTEPAAGEAWQCKFCGVAYEPDAPSAPATRVHVVEVEATRPKASIVVIAISMAVLLAIGVILGQRILHRQTNYNKPYVPGAMAVRTRAAITPSELKDLTTSGYRPLTVAAPAGGYGAIDPVAALPWALSIAQAWSSDATFERIDVSRLRPDGTVNAQDDKEGSLQYRFASPSRREKFRQQAELSKSAEGVIGLWIRVQNGQPEAYAEVGRPMLMTVLQEQQLHAHPVARPLADVMREPAVRKALKPVPFFTAYLIYIDREGWAWYVSTLANEAMPRIRARDGAVFPYPR